LTSFTSRHVEFDGSLAGTTFGYSYFRGLDDHQPILLARKIHSLATYGLAMLIGGLVAIALNMKIDASLLVGVLGLAIVILGWRSGLESFGRQILLSAGSFALVYAVTNPEVLINPCFVLSRQMPPTGDPLGLARTVRQNLPVLGLFLETNLVPWKISNLPLGMLSIGLVTLVLGTITIVHRRGGANPLALTIPTAAVLMLWLYPMLTISSFNARYYLNGLGALYALVGATLVTSWRSRASVARACVVAVLALLLVQYGALMSTHRAAAAQATAQTFYVAVGDRHNGFARGFTRNEIERRAIEASARRRLRPHHPGRSARLFRPADAAVGKHEAGVCQYVQLRRSVARPRSVGRSFAAALAGELCDGSQLVEPVGDLMDARGGAAV